MMNIFKLIRDVSLISDLTRPIFVIEDTESVGYISEVVLALDVSEYRVSVKVGEGNEFVVSFGDALALEYSEDVSGVSDAGAGLYWMRIRNLWFDEVFVVSVKPARSCTLKYALLKGVLIPKHLLEKGALSTIVPVPLRQTVTRAATQV